jgi:hypothetical protein
MHIHEYTWNRRLFFPLTTLWRIAMNPLIPAKTLGHGLVLISALFLLQANSALAAEAVGDAQRQASDLLSGTVGGRAKMVDASRAIASASEQTPGLDPQEQARQLILGKPNLGGTNALGAQINATPAVSARGNYRRYADPQESARRMILGYRAGVPGDSAQTVAAG